MITAKFVFSENELILGFDIQGHSGSAEKGQDIICSAVSSPAYMVVNTITEVLLLNPDISENDGRLKIKLNSHEAEKSRDILKGFYIHIKQLSQMYPDNIKVERGAI